MRHLHTNQVLFLHKRIAELDQSMAGVRDMNLLESAVMRPQASFGGQDLYQGIYLKASALVHSLIRNHPFVDGNKRTGFEAMRLFLRLNGQDLRASESAKYKFVMQIANDNSLSEERIADWLQQNTVNYTRRRPD